VFRQRWSFFFDVLAENLQYSLPFNSTVFDTQVAEIEWNWVLQNKTYPFTPQGNTISEIKRIYAKYFK
jgi:hypothetical protein